MKTYKTQIEIVADPDVVWRALTQDMPISPTAYGILRFEGDITLSSKIKLWSEVVPKRAFKLTVVTLDEPQRMIWRGGMPFGLFTGTRHFSLTKTDTGCTFAMKEVFSGPLSGIITKSMPDLGPSFRKFAQTLKTKAEEQ